MSPPRYESTKLQGGCKMNDLIWGTNHISRRRVTGREECQFRIWTLWWYQIDQFGHAVERKNRMVGRLDVRDTRNTPRNEFGDLRTVS